MRELRLNGQGLRALPAAAYAHADTLELLDLSGNAFEALPQDLPRFRRLRILFASNNRLTDLPASLGECPALEMMGFKSNAIAHLPGDALPARLRWLILTDNAVSALPESVGERPRLQKLMLAGNRLCALPESLRGAPALELLRIAANRFERLPDWLPDLPRLAWLAWGGNPMTASLETDALADAASRTVPAADLTPGERLGEGASGVIDAADWAHAGGTSAVAVKRFKGSVTSDGWPSSEMAACLAAGAHEALVPVHGPRGGADEGARALVLGRLPAGASALAAPPSFDSCTRDIYPDGLRLRAATVRRWAHDVASAMAQLHARGLVHGDLYAHNLLRAGDRLWLSDLGAASFLPPGQPSLHAFLRATDVRAFGVLLGEWLERLPPKDADAVRTLFELQARCINAANDARIGFASLAEML